MLNSQRIFVEVLRKYCAEREIAIDVKSDGWLIVMQRGATRRCAFGYDIGLNSAVARTGGLIATALLGGVLAARGSALVAAFHVAAIVGAAACVAAAASALLVARKTR